MSTRRRALASVSAGIGLLLAFATATAAVSGTSDRSFAGIVRSSRLVILATVHQAADGGYSLDIERVFKGQASGRLTYPPSPTDALQPGWKQAVVAFSRPDTLDFRTPTIAWHVGEDGTIDPEGYGRVPGLPATLDAMIAYFADLPSSNAGQPSSSVPLSAIGLVFVLLGWWGLGRRRKGKAA